MLAGKKQKRQNAGADGKRHWVNRSELTRKGPNNLRNSVATARHTEDMPKLAGGDQQTRCSDETRDHRVRQEIGQKAESKDPHEHQHAAGE